MEAQWIDIGSLLEAAREDMKVGQLVHGEAFSLFEAMSALEVGNPKMDAAAIPGGAPAPPLEQLLADPAAAPLDLTPPLLLAVLDRLLCMEASWHCGGSAMQTVYSCLYMLQIDRLESVASSNPCARVLSAYCRALQCDCVAVRDLVMAGGVAEEEDINIMTAGLPFEPPAGVTPGSVAAGLDAAMEAAAALAAAPANGGATAAAAGDLVAALRSRLALRRAVHVALLEAVSHDAAVVRGAASKLLEARQLLALVRESAALAAPHEAAPAFHPDANRHLLGPAPPRQVQLLPLPDSLSYWERTLDHMGMAVAVPEHVYDCRSLQQYLWRFARQTPAPSVVPRSLLHLLITPSHWESQAAAAADGQQAAEAATSSSNGSAAGGGKGGKGGKAGGRGGGKGGKGGAGKGGAGGDGASTSGAGEPAWVPSPSMIAQACAVPYKAGLPEEAELFFGQAVIAFSNLCQALLMNRCRCRRHLKRGLDDWANMYHHGANADVVPAVQEHYRAAGWRWRPLDWQAPDDPQGPLATWVEYQTCLVALHHLLMGFPLDLYEPKEYDMIYWYCDFLCTSAIQAIGALFQRRPPLQPPKPAAAAGLGGRGLGRGLGGRGLGGKDPAAAAAAAAEEMARFEKSQMQLRYEVVEVEALQQLCQGMLRTMAGLRMAGCLPPPHPDTFNTGVQRFGQRFAAMAPLTRPVPLSHAEYSASMDPGERGANFLLALGVASFKEARVRCAALTSNAPSPDLVAPGSGWVKQLEKVAGVNAVAAGVLAHKVTAGDKVSVSFEWVHPYFPTIVLPKAAPAAAPAASSTSSADSTTTKA